MSHTETKIDNQVCIVVPSIREVNIREWFRRWSDEIGDAHVILIEDNQHRSFSIETKHVSYSHYCWDDIDKDLKEKSWIIPRRTDCIRSYGFYLAWRRGASMVISLDDDCYPDDPNFITTHYRRLFHESYYLHWFQHAQTVRVRGVPTTLSTTSAIANMGLWSNIPDLDARAQLQYPDLHLEKSHFTTFVPFGYYAPISIMNLAIKREALPSAYCLLMGKEYDIDRFGDIWMGIILKKICDHLSVYITGGDPYVRHERASNVFENLEKEEPGYALNEQLWKDIHTMQIEGSTFKECYLSVAKQLPEYSSYWTLLKKAMKVWVSLFD